MQALLLRIYNESNSSASSFVIMYIESMSEKICGSTTIPAATCINGQCTYVFEVTSSLCTPSSDITFSVSGSNILGNGPSVRFFAGLFDCFCW